MSILNKLKIKKKKSVREKELSQARPAGFDAKRDSEKQTMPANRQGSAPYKVMLKPHITEKSMRLADNNQYTFKVRRDASKEEIKGAVEEIYGVNVVKVRVINVRKKERILGRTRGWKKGFKKAIVKVKKGQKIEFMPK